MKNIHVLPTEKPSRLYYNANDKNWQLCEFHKYHTDIKPTHNIYITNSEEIKEGDWCFEVHNENSKATTPNFIDEKGNKWWLRKANANDIAGCPTTKKIILTTDQDLIKDGVQTIDDEFLEWFVKNPSCERVDVDYRYDTNLQPILDSFGNKVLRIKLPTESENLSQIIIPKVESKQSTLEEATERYANMHQDVSEELGIYLVKVVFQDGAKWQQEQDKKMYSEEEVLKFSEWFAFELTRYGYPTEENIIKALKEIKRILKTNKI
jgi:hypothetical protein